MNIRFHLLTIGTVLALAIGLTLFKIPLASSQGLTLVAVEVPENLPVADPDSDLWQKATAVEVPLSAQIVARPMLPETKVKSVTVRALHNNTQLAFLVEWADETQDDRMVRVQDFRDAVALQFPLAEGPPFFCMGQQGGNVNIWHWKADWQADIAARQDVDTQYPAMYVDGYTFVEPATNISAGPADYTDPAYLPALAADNLFAVPVHDSPVEDLVAGGFGSLTTQPIAEQNVQGYGAWAGGKWRVIFSRDMASTEADDVAFTTGQVYGVAFAAWDGANQERNGQKSTSQWVSLQFAGPAGLAQTGVEPAAPQENAAPAAAGASSESNMMTIAILSLVLVIMGSLLLLFTLVLLSKLPDRK